LFLTRTFLKGYKNFKEETNFHFDKINLIKGKNGSGKSTVANDSVLFCLWGYSSQVLEKLATRSLKTKTFRVRQEWEVKGKKIIIERHFPTSLVIYEEGKKLSFSTARDSQEYINRLFGKVDTFKRFRMIDTKEGINILEEGKTAIKKSLFSLQEDWFNTIRQKLLDKKRERENYSKDKTIWKHFPSEKRFDILKKNILEFINKHSSLLKEVSKQNKILSDISFNIGKIRGRDEIFHNRLREISVLNICPTCTQIVLSEVKERIQTDLSKEIVKCSDDTYNLNIEIEREKEVIRELSGLQEEYSLNLTKLREYESRLETAIKQKDYKWTKKDILLIDSCIKELDNFYDYFITEWLRTLEPIMNNVLDKIGFRVIFKNDFDLVLHKEGEEYYYKDLSTGQKLILSIALKIAILIERNETGIMIVDEGFSSLDDENLDYILKLFKDFPFQLFAIIHRYLGENEENNIISL
jgi:DNA repair exonuclease SbcCD ATPase subunit